MDQPPGATLLAGGYRNEVWRRRIGHQWVIEKRYREPGGDANPMYPNLPDSEARALGLLGPLGLAPRLVTAEPNHLVYEYVAGRMWRPGRHESVAEVGRLLHSIHTVAPGRGFRRLCRSAAEAVAHADEMIAAAGTHPDVQRIQAARPVSASRSEPARLALVHTDCGPGNLIRSPRGLVLIDWQCPGIGDAVEDVACFLSPAMMVLYGCRPHSGRAHAAFLAAYPDDEVVARHRRDGAAWHYRIAAYCAWRAERLATSDPVVAARYRTAIDAELARAEPW